MSYLRFLYLACILFVCTVNTCHHIDFYHPANDRTFLKTILADYSYWLLGNDSREQALVYLEKSPDLSVLRVDNKLVGFVNYEILNETFLGLPLYQYGYINGLAVDKNHQKKGYGSLLLAHAIEQLCHHVGVIRLRVNTDNADALSLYLHHGFTITGDLVREDGAKQHTCELRLSASIKQRLLQLCADSFFRYFLYFKIHESY